MRSAALLVLMASALSTPSCGRDSVGPDRGAPVPSSIEIEPIQVEFGAIGDSIQLTAASYDGSGTLIPQRSDLTWSVRDTTVARVDETGVIHAISNGSTLVSATVARTMGSATVTVRQRTATLEVGAQSRDLSAGDTLTLTATARDANGHEIERPSITWSLSDSSVATISRTGLIRALTHGTTTVTASSDRVSQSTDIVVQRLNISISSIAPAILRPGGSAEIRGTGFSALASRNTVRIDGASASIRTASDSLLTVTLPPLSSFVCGPEQPVQVTVEFGGERASAFHPLATARTVSLGLGEEVFLDVPDVHCVELAGQNGEYLTGVYNVSPSATSTSAFRLQGIRPGGTNSDIEAPTSVAELRMTEEDLTAALHFEHLEEERRLHEELGRKSGVRPGGVSRNMVAAPPPAVGSVIDFNIRIRGAGNACTQFETLKTRVAYLGEKVIMLEDMTGPLVGTMDQVYQRVGEEFERDMLPILEEYYGDPFAMDQALGSDGRIRMVFTPKVNADNLLGFVTSANMRDRSSCASSMMAPTMYVKIATTAGSGLSGNTADNWYRTIRPTIIHEAKHIVSHAQRIRQGAPFEVSWLEEGTARISEEIWARTVFGYDQLQNTDYQTALYCEDPPGRVGCTGAEPRIMHKHFGQFNTYLRNSAERSPLGRVNDSESSFYGSAWSFIRWAIDHSGISESNFLRTLTGEGRLTGVANLQARTGIPFEEMVGLWTFANFLDDYPGLITRPELQHPSWNMRSVFEGLNGTFPGTYRTEFPLVPRRVPFGNFQIDVAEVRGGSTDFTILSSSVSQNQYLQLESPNGGAPSPALRIGIVRIR